MSPEPSKKALDDLDALLHICAARVLRDSDGERFIAWFVDNAGVLAPGLFRPNPAPEQRAALQSLSRALWNRMPLPEHQFRPRPLPKPERNAPCPCGSGRKYKLCCAQAETAEDPFAGVSLLKYVLECYPSARLKEIPVAALPQDELAYIANAWLEHGRGEDAISLLEPLFVDANRLDHRAEFAFDTLCDCYTELDRPRKKKRLIDAVLQSHDKKLRSAAYHRQITVLADRGEWKAAWRLFHEALRWQPNNPLLATLEVTLLQAQGEMQHARERAQLWIARLGRDHDRDHGELIATLRDLTDVPEEAYFEFACAEAPELERLRSLVVALPAPECHYSLAADGEFAGPLEPSRTLAEVAVAWQSRTQIDKPFLVEMDMGPEAWYSVAEEIEWLAHHPLAWQCFDVLDDVVGALARWRGNSGVTQLVLLPLLRHAEALLRRVIGDNRAQGKQLHWAFLGNRSALRLLAGLIYTLLDLHAEDAAIALMEWMVYGLNPNDNHGLREILAQRYLHRGDAQAALALMRRYPQDMPPMQYHRVLALFMTGQKDQAGKALAGLRSEYPEILKMLLAAKPRRPAMELGRVKVGGRDEAWCYREDCLEMWRKSGALDWARGQRPDKPSLTPDA